MSRAQQLPLTLSIADSAAVQQDRDLAVIYAREERARATALDEECRQLRAALKAAQTRIRDLERESSSLRRP